MAVITRGQQSSPQNPVLSAFFLAPDGGLLDPEVIEYAIFANLDSGFGAEQIFPDPSGLIVRAAVDVSAAPIGDRLSLGRYVARWAAGPEQDVGRYEVRWWYRHTLADTVEFTFAQTFEVLADARARGPAYALVQDLRDEGIPKRVSDTALHQKIVRASRLFELYTGRTFEPAYKTLRGDGRGTGVLTLGEPIIAVEAVHYSGNRYYEEGDWGRQMRVLRVYNRHMTGLMDPDDRENPRLEIAFYSGLAGGRFTHGQQNVYVRGVFGYTEFVDGGPPAGQTPDLVQHAVKLLTFKDVPRLWDVAEREDHQKRWRLTGESTRDQSYSMLGGVDAATRGAVLGGTTGDPEIDNIIILYRRGAQVGAA